MSRGKDSTQEREMWRGALRSRFERGMIRAGSNGIDRNRRADARTPASSRRLPQDRIECLGRLPLHRRRDVRVEVERRADLRMPEHLRDDLRMHALAQQQGRGGMAEVVKANAGQASALQQRLERPALAVCPVRAPVGHCVGGLAAVSVTSSRSGSPLQPFLTLRSRQHRPAHRGQSRKSWPRRRTSPYRWDQRWRVPAH